jgi:hypothetical protein
MLLAAGVTFLTLGSAPSARAGCGDYVHMGGHRMQPETKTGQIPSLPTPLPCSGPRCSQGQPPITPPPAAPVPVENDRWSLPRFAETPPNDSLCWIAFDDADSRPLNRQSSVYHPPR